MIKLSLGVLASIQLLVQLALQVVVLSYVGAGSDTDAYVAALTIPLLIFSVLSVSFQSVWQPRLAVLAQNRAQWLMAQRIAQGQVLLVFSASAAILFLSADNWVPVIFPGFTPAQADLTAKMARIMLVGAVFNGQAALFTTAQRARERFIATEIIPIASSLAAIAAVAVTVEDYGIESVAWVSLVRSLLDWGILFCFAGCPRPYILGAWRSDAWSNIYPLLAGSSLYKTGPVIDRFWMSQDHAGGVTIFNLVQTGMGAFASVLDRAFAVSVAPRLARLASAGDMRGMQVLYRKCIWQTTLVVGIVPIVLLAAWPAWPHVMEILLRIPGPLAKQMWIICFLLLGYLQVAACGSIVVTAFYALGDTSTPVKLSVTSFILWAVLKSMAFLTFGMLGLAIATSAYYVFNLSVLCVLLEKRIRADPSRRR